MQNVTKKDETGPFSLPVKASSQTEEKKLFKSCVIDFKLKLFTITFSVL